MRHFSMLAQRCRVEMRSIGTVLYWRIVIPPGLHLYGWRVMRLGGKEAGYFERRLGVKIVPASSAPSPEFADFN